MPTYNRRRCRQAQTRPPADPRMTFKDTPHENERGLSFSEAVQARGLSSLTELRTRAGGVALSTASLERMLPSVTTEQKGENK